MKATIKLFFLSLILVTFFIVFSKHSRATEGTIELRSTTGQNFRCYAASLQMQDLAYNLPFTCRNLIYPIEETIFNYVLWATPTDGTNALRLGVLGLGKGEFRVVKPFTNLFVTTEQNPGVGLPEGKVVMKGNVNPIDFLETPTTPTPTPEGQISEPELPKPLSTRDKLFLALRRAGIAALLALVALIGLIFVITRSRG